MASAQEKFAELLRNHLGPALRSIGFKGSGQEFVRPDDNLWIMIGIQRSAFSDLSELRFTVQLTVIHKRKWADLRAAHPGQPGFRDRPYPTRFYGQGLWQWRLGRLFPTPEDKWWIVTPDSDASVVAEDVVAAIRTYGVPAIAREAERARSS